MHVSYYIDPETEQAHIYNHGVDEYEVKDVMLNAIQHLPADDGARMALGLTRGGRYLKVIYTIDEYPPDSYRIITAYDLRGKALKALRRRQRRRN